VLITLAIIGIIAAITIPSIVANHQKRTLETQFAKAYRTLQQAVNLAVAEHGDIISWDWEGLPGDIQKRDEFTKKYFVPYLNVGKFCPTDKSVKGCFLDKNYTFIDGGASNYNYERYNHPSVLLADGISITFSFEDSTDRDIVFVTDINGHKKPHTFGRDLFAIVIKKEANKIMPHGNNRAKNKNFDCRKADRGWYCAAQVVSDGFKMNY